MHHSLHFQHFYPSCICSFDTFPCYYLVVVTVTFTTNWKLNSIWLDLNCILLCVCVTVVALEAGLAAIFTIFSQYVCVCTILTRMITYIQQKIHKINNPFDLERVCVVCDFNDDSIEPWLCTYLYVFFITKIFNP